MEGEEKKNPPDLNDGLELKSTEFSGFWRSVLGIFIVDEERKKKIPQEVVSDLTGSAEKLDLMSAGAKHRIATYWTLCIHN